MQVDDALRVRDAPSNVGADRKDRTDILDALTAGRADRVAARKAWRHDREAMLGDELIRCVCKMREVLG